MPRLTDPQPCEGELLSRLHLVLYPTMANAVLFLCNSYIRDAYYNIFTPTFTSAFIYVLAMTLMGSIVLPVISIYATTRTIVEDWRILQWTLPRCAAVLLSTAGTTVQCLLSRAWIQHNPLDGYWSTLRWFGLVSPVFGLLAIVFGAVVVCGITYKGINWMRQKTL